MPKYTLVVLGLLGLGASLVAGPSFHRREKDRKNFPSEIF